MKTIDILKHFLDRSDWVDRAKTVDRVIIGDAEKEVRTCLVTWISSLAALRVAIERKVDLVVTHEPTFYSHRNELDHIDETETGRAKRRFIEDHGLIVLRLHDTWDRWPDVGIPWSWARFLGLTGPPAAVSENGYQHRYDIKPTTVGDFAKRVAARTASIGEPYVQVTGDPGRTVSKIGVGTGCACGIAEFERMGCDLSIVCDDGSCYWGPIQRAEDAGHAVIRVNHGTSEEPGMVALAGYIDENLDGVSAEHLPHGATFRLVGG